MEGQKDSEPGRSATARAVALAHLLHQECKNLLELYVEILRSTTNYPRTREPSEVLQRALRIMTRKKERESFLSHHVPEGERLLIFDLCTDTPSSTQRIGHAHSALSRCLEMLECLIAREMEELGEEFEGEYETARKTVKDRLGHLLHSTGALLENGEGVCAPLPEFQCIQDLDEVEGSGSFASKLWTYRVLLELIHWSDSATHALRLLHSEQENEQEL